MTGNSEFDTNKILFDVLSIIWFDFFKNVTILRHILHISFDALNRDFACRETLMR